MEKDSLERFLAEVRSSCNEHAKRKGYTDDGADKGDVLGPIMEQLGVAQDHAIGEIIAKLVEFRKAPRGVVAVKVAGWAWKLWTTRTDKEKV